MGNGTLHELKRDSFGRRADWGWAFITEQPWMSIVEQSERGGQAD